MPNNKTNKRRNRSNNTNSNLAGLRFLNEPAGKPPRHPGAAKGPITPRNRRGRARNIQTYPEVHIREPTVANKYMRFRSAATLKNKPYINYNFKKELMFGRLDPKTWLEIQRMTIPEYRKWTLSLTPSEQEELKAYL